MKELTLLLAMLALSDSSSADFAQVAADYCPWSLVAPVPALAALAQMGVGGMQGALAVAWIASGGPGSL